MVLAIEVSPAMPRRWNSGSADSGASEQSRRGGGARELSAGGVGLGHGLPSLRNAEGSRRRLSGRGASGIAAFLTGSEAAEADHVLVLGSEPQRITWWLEQNALRGAEAQPISVGLSASAGPLLGPYLEGGRVEGWVTGLSQALAYRETRGDADLRGDGSEGATGRVVDLLMIAHWAVAALLLIAFFYNLFGKRGAS